tara:strand:- start:3404 stop:3814 length:411 start_codon:yes stop_codon:yes gene_type:complete
MARKKRKYQETGFLPDENQMNLIEQIKSIFQRRQKWDDIGTDMGQGKAMVVTDSDGNERKIKTKGPEGKLKTKYNPDGSIKKQVLSKGLRRVVNKPKRDSKLSEFNRMRNIQDQTRSERNPEVMEWIKQHMPTLFD